MYLKTLPFNKSLFKKDLKMIIPIIIIVAIIMFFVTTLPITTAYQRYKDEITFYESEGYEYNEDEILESRIRDVNYQLEDVNEFYPIIVIVVPVVVAAILFGEEKRRKTFEVLSTMPFTRYEIFFSKLLVALVAIVFPFLLNGLIMLLALVLNSNLRIFYSAIQVLTWIIKFIYYQLPFLSFAFLFGTLAGTTIAQFILTAIFLVFPMGFTYLLFSNISCWLRSGFWRLSGFSDIWDKVAEYSFFEVFNSSYRGSKHYIYYITLSIVLFIISKILFDKNKIERSGETLEFENIETFFKVGVTVCTALLMGLISVWIFEDLTYHVYAYKSIFLVLGYIVGGLLGWYLSKLSIKFNRIKE
ncbi:ABC transporter permease subunit [Anaerosalibacter sp. Marseille-P3206]|uniref:ABC transporter permease subunit n=1 Tax=Anaerosalibacter sp. Marseille-P3206 TaxID=1871005 RepID=UPI00098595AB|nr:ABC transporter permease subunit [Anaerosalibacter sp. Marseille-P3206]